MLYDAQSIPELNTFYHRNDDIKKNYFDYENVILDKSLSPYIYKNDVMNTWLNKMQPIVALSFDKMNIIKNFKNYIVDKYEYRHSS